MMFTYLRQLTETDDSKILFILALICGAMILDFASGTLAAWSNLDIEFKNGHQRDYSQNCEHYLTSVLHSCIGLSSV